MVWFLRRMESRNAGMARFQCSDPCPPFLLVSPLIVLILSLSVSLSLHSLSWGPLTVCLLVFDQVKNVPLLIRSCLPAPMFSRNDFSIWSILKKCIGLVRTCFVEWIRLSASSCCAPLWLVFVVMCSRNCPRSPCLSSSMSLWAFYRESQSTWSTHTSSRKPAHSPTL